MVWKGELELNGKQLLFTYSEALLQYSPVVIEENSKFPWELFSGPIRRKNSSSSLLLMLLLFKTFPQFSD
jgi:hypothetical protein